MAEPFATESYETHRQRLVSASLPPALGVVIGVTLLYAGVDFARASEWPAAFVLPYAGQLLVPLVAWWAVRGPLANRAESVALAADLLFTAVIAVRVLLPTSTVSGVVLVLSAKMLSTALFVPWGARTQYVAAAATVVTYWIALASSGRVNWSEAALHQSIGPLVAAVLSCAGAARAERGRQDLFARDVWLRREAEVARGLARVGRELIAALGTPDLFRRLCEVTTEVLHCDASHTLVWSPAQEAYVPVAAYGYPEEGWETVRVVKVDPVAAAEAMSRLQRDGIRQTTTAKLSEAGWQALAAGLGITSSMGMALRRGDDLIGIHAACYRGSTAAFTPLQEEIGGGIAQLATLAIENARLVEELENNSRVKSEFVATISHELRSPLNVIIGYLDLLRDGAYGAMTPEQNDLVARVDRSSHQLLELITTTLDLSRIEGGQLQLDRRDVTVGDLMDEIEEETRDLREKPGLHFQWHVDAGLPPLHTDPLKLKVVIKNLIGNAVKFTDEGSVHVEARRRDDGVEIRVADTGIGIPGDLLEAVFEAFRQVNRSARRERGGVGLGLFIVRRLVDLLGGTVEVESTVGEGSSFRVWVPFQAAAAGSGSGSADAEGSARAS